MQKPMQMAQFELLKPHCPLPSMFTCARLSHTVWFQYLEKFKYVTVKHIFLFCAAHKLPFLVE